MSVKSLTFQQFAAIIDNAHAVIIDNYAVTFPSTDINEDGTFATVEISYTDDGDCYENVWDEDDVSYINVVDDCINVGLDNGEVYQVNVLEIRTF